MSWNQFQFYDLLPLRDPNLGTSSPLYSDPTLTAVCSTSQYLILATTSNDLKFLDSQYQIIKQFKAYDMEYRITLLRQVIPGFIVSIAERQGYPSQLKLWSLEKILNRDPSKLNTSTYHSLVSVKNGNNTYPITGFTFTPQFNVLAVGFANGTVVIIRGDIMRDRGSSQTVGYKDPALDPITNLQFISHNEYDHVLYVTTTSKVLTIPTTQSYKPGSETLLSQKEGADINCVTISEDKLLIAKDEGLSYYELNGGKYCVSLSMPKRRIANLSEDQLLIETSNVNDSSALVYSGHVESTRIVIVDMKHKLISFSHSLPSAIRDVLQLWNNEWYILTVDGTLYQLKAKSIKERIDVVLERDMYPIAIQIAESSKIPNEDLLKIKKRYGDYLYDKDETTDAMSWYITIIGLGSTTEIIRKYKDGKEVTNLSRYLEALLKEGVASKEHVTLLLSTYCKMKNFEKFESFIEKYEEWCEKSSEDLDIDMDLVLELCKDTELFLQPAAKLAMKLNQPSLAFEILLRDLKDRKAALSYLRTLPVFEVLRVLIDYGRALLECSPLTTTLLMIEVFTGKYKPQQLSQGTATATTKEEPPVLIQSYKAFISIMSQATATVTDTVTTTAASLAPNLSNTSSPSLTITDNDEPTYQPPRPRIIFPSFVNNPNEFVIFLEACAERLTTTIEVPKKDKDDILTTLFELYLTLAEKSPEKQKQKKKEWQEKALEVIKENDLDRNTVILISDVFGFKSEVESVVYQDDDSGYSLNLIRAAIAADDIAKVQSIIDTWGGKEPELYVLALGYYISSESTYAQVGNVTLKSLLEIIHKKKILSPLEVIQALSKTNVAPLSLIKPYVISLLDTTSDEITQTEKLINNYKSNLVKLQNSNSALQQPTQSQPGVKCTHCHNAILNDRIQFLCSHTYHKLCLSTGSQCPLCTPHRETITSIKEKRKDHSERFEVLKESLKEAQEGQRFKVTTEWFGKGVMGDVRYIIDKDAVN